MQVEEGHIEVSFRGARDSEQAVGVGLVVAAEDALLMCEASELLDADVEDARVLGVREEYRRGAVGEGRLEGFDVWIALFVGLDYRNFVSLDDGHGAVRGVREERRDYLVALVLLALVAPVGADYRGEREDAVRAAAGLHREDVEAGDFLEELACLVEHFEDALRRLVGLERVHICDLRLSREAVVDFRVVLHRAGSLPDVYVAVYAYVFLRKVVVVAHELELRYFGKVGAFFAHHGRGQRCERFVRADAFAAGPGDEHSAFAGLAEFVYYRFVPLSLMEFLHSFKIVHRWASLRENFAEGGGEGLYVVRGSLLRHREQRASLKLGEGSAEVVAAEYAALKQRPVDFLHGFSARREIYDELLERRAGEPVERKAPDSREILPQADLTLKHRLAELAHTLRPHRSEVDARRDAPERRVRSDEFLRVVAVCERRAFPEDVAKAPFFFARRRDAEEARRVFVYELRLVLRRNESCDAAAVVHVEAERLNVAAGDVRAVLRRRRQHAERRGLDVGDHERALRVRHLRYILRALLDYAEEVRIHHKHGSGLVCEVLLEAVEADAARLRVVAGEGDFNVGLEVGPYGAQRVRVDVRRNDDFVSVRDAAGHAQSRADGLSAVVVRHVAYVHVKQLRHHRLILEHRMEASVVFVRLARVGSEEFGAVHDLVHEGRYVSVVAARAEEADKLFRSPVLAEYSVDVAREPRFIAERLRQRHFVLHAHIFGNVGNQILD